VDGCPIGSEEGGQPCVAVFLVRRDDLSRWSSTVSVYRSTMSADCGCRAVVRVLPNPRCCDTSRMRRDSKLGLSYCAALVVLRSGRRSWSSELLPPRRLLVEDGVGLCPPAEIFHRRFLCSLYGNDPATSMAALSKGAPTPDSSTLTGCTCHSASTTA
jgi:hypothetical protein